MNLDFKFSSSVAEKVFISNKRIIDWISGYNSGKTWTAIQKSLFLALTFSGYRIGVFRSNATDLKRTTRQTFLKVCPPELIARDTDGAVPETELVNGSKYYWLHVDQHTVNSIKSLELNMAIYDQAEDLLESVFDAIDARVGRWENVVIPEELKSHLSINKFTGKPEVPAYFVLLANPPDEGEINFLYSSLEPNDDCIIEKGEFLLHKENSRVAFFESSSVLNQAINEENLNTLLSRDKVFVDRFVHGKRGSGQGTIHTIHPNSILEFDAEFLEKILKKAALVRVMDYGASAPTAVTWWANYKGIHICYREYYVADKTISYHRKEIAELSSGEYYVGNYADPSIFKRTQEKQGGRYSIADEYRDESLYSVTEGDAPPILFAPADNNEFATRNRINELLQLSERNTHPITNSSNAPGVYFIRRSLNYPNGCHNIIRQTSAQKKMLLDTINGKPIYSDERDETVTDHAYDTLRYYVSIHMLGNAEAKPKPDRMSFIEIMRRIKARKIYEEEFAN